MNIFLFFLLFQISKFYNLNGIYSIKNLYNNYYFYLEKNRLILSKTQTNFRIIPIESNLYYMETKHSRKKIGINNNNKIIKYDKDGKIKNESKIIWNIEKINEKEYYIQNHYNQRYIEIKELSLQCNNNIYDLSNHSNEKLNNFIFNFVKLVDEAELVTKNVEIIKCHIF